MRFAVRSRRHEDTSRSACRLADTPPPSFSDNCPEVCFVPRRAVNNTQRGRGKRRVLSRTSSCYRCPIGTVLGAFLVAAVCCSQLAAAQSIPPGSYLRSCGEAYLQGDT